MNSREQAIKRLQARKRRLAGVADDMAREGLRFQDIADREPTRAISAFNLFQTTEPIADLMAQTLFPDVTAPGRMLEPNAGLGRLYRAVRYRSDRPIVLVEIAPQCCDELYRETRGDDQATLLQRDFLECDSTALGGFFEFILMNPPFKMGRDVKHIRHAITLLQPGGRLVSLCYAGKKQRAAFEHDPKFRWTLLPDNSFASEGTSAAVAMLEYTRD